MLQKRFWKSTPKMRTCIYLCTEAKGLEPPEPFPWMQPLSQKSDVLEWTPKVRARIFWHLRADIIIPCQIFHILATTTSLTLIFKIKTKLKLGWLCHTLILFHKKPLYKKSGLRWPEIQEQGRSITTSAKRDQTGKKFWFLTKIKKSK